MTSGGEHFLPHQEDQAEQQMLVDQPLTASIDVSDIPHEESPQTIEPEPVAGFTELEFEENYRRLAPSIIGHLVSKGVPVQNAEDVVQEGFFSVWQARHRLPDLPHSSYFFRAVTNKHINSTRKQHPVPVQEEHLPLEPVFDNTPHIERVLDTRTLIRQQPQHYHAIGELLMLDFTYQEIAEILDMNPATVKTRANRLRKYLTQSKS